MGCSSPSGPAPTPSGSVAVAASPADAPDPTFDTCRARYDAAMKEPAAPGAPAYDAHRPEFLGRARGEPVLFVRAPAPSPVPSSPAARIAKQAYDKEPPGLRVAKLRDRLKHDKPSLRALLLREGYLFAEDPDDLFTMVEKVSLTDLFDEEPVYLLRKGEVSRLERSGTQRDPSYAFAEGPSKGRSAQLLFGDRVAPSAADLDRPLTRDVAMLADREGFERLRVDRLTEGDIAATLKFGDLETKAVLAPMPAERGSLLELACIDEPKATRELASSHAASSLHHREALRALRGTVTDVVFEALPFDRPRGVTGPDRDGELRPFWTSAYLRGQQSFEHDDETYLVFRADGRPSPPTVCVDFVLESFERTSGGWFAPRGEKPHREKGRLSFDDHGSDRPRGVVALGKFAEDHPDLFEMRRFAGGERIPFGDRPKFFAFLTEHADLFQAGDILSIQGLKRDDRVHQHAILLEGIDPISGFPYALADQMKLPRRRTWEGIMAEAPKRSLYYRLRPQGPIIDALLPSTPADPRPPNLPASAPR